MKGLIYNILPALLLLLSSCSGGKEAKDSETAAAERELELARLSEMLRPVPLTANPYDWHLDSMPSGGKKLRINYLGGTLGRVFNDSNYLHVEAARALGISPIDNPAKAWHASRPLVKIVSNPDFTVDELTHSMPYLVPEAAELLHEIGRNFNDTLRARGGGAYRLKVTSVLRTPTTVKSLRRRNVNAVETSTHLFGTTFDISYSQFICLNDSMPRTQEDLKNLLGEILYDLKQRGRCYIKYERKQACFHITVRPPAG